MSDELNFSETEESDSSGDPTEVGIPVVGEEEIVPVSAIRAEVRHEFAVQLAKAELRAKAAEDGYTLAEGITDYIDFSKVLDSDGHVRPEVVEKVLKQFGKEKIEWPDLHGVGTFPSRGPVFPEFNLDARRR
ncbi:hypothetical protein [Streptomyces zagrosensis]|uniref:Uncharacterized protein n=1 Tax=Streptomyces zagrosensis TaxID=1042984 RepID=A0A7W9QES8_9ACTN|nr:hypothetical protein [Streptomyces zagrosensis]MBB5938811.1 hypothetical protein [Streptomyces zagrosensis]